MGVDDSLCWGIYSCVDTIIGSSDVITFRVGDEYKIACSGISFDILDGVKHMSSLLYKYFE